MQAGPVFVQSFFFLIRNKMNAMIVGTGVVGEYLSVLEFAHSSWNLVLALLMSPTSLKTLIHFQTVPGIAVEDEDQGQC